MGSKRNRSETTSPDTVTNSTGTPNEGLLKALSQKKEVDDLFVEFYFSEESSQEDRNFIQRALYLFASRTKRIRLLTPEEVDAEIAVSLVQGMLGNGSSLVPFNIPSRSPKHISAFVNYVQLRRAAHNNVTVFISLDGGGFFQVR